MAKTIKSLLRISMAIRNLGTYNDHKTTRRFFQSASNFGKRSNNDALVLLQPYLPIAKNSCQPMFRHCENRAEIFNLIRLNEKAMRGPDAAMALYALYRIEKTCDKKIEKMYENDDFLLVCRILKKNIRQLRVTHAISALKAFVYFNVPVTCVIVQEVLQIVRHTVNDLTIGQIEALDYLFGMTTGTPIMGALTAAMKIVYERNVTIQLDRENLKQLLHSYRYLCQRSGNNEILGMVIRAIRDCNEPIDFATAMTIVWSSSSLRNQPPGLDELLNEMQTIIAQNVTNAPRAPIKHLIRHISLQFKHRDYRFYHEVLMDACASAVISDDWGFSDAVAILRYLTNIGYTQIFLLDYLAAKCFEDPTIMEQNSRNITTLLKGFVQADYKPVFWDVMQEHFVTSLGNMDLQPSKLIGLTVNLIALDCYRPELVEKVFTSYAHGVPKEKYLHAKLLLLYQAIRTLYPKYSGPWPTDEIINQPALRTMVTVGDFPLIAALESALGGRRYVLSNVRSSLGHVIDHVLVMRKGGFPVAINNQSDPESDVLPIHRLTDLKAPPNSQVIILRLIPWHGYSLNSQRMKGMWTLKIRTLEALSGYTVIPIDASMWARLPALEQIPYLMQAIRLKCDDISFSTNP